MYGGFAAGICIVGSLLHTLHGVGRLAETMELFGHDSPSYAEARCGTLYAPGAIIGYTLQSSPTCDVVCIRTLYIYIYCLSWAVLFRCQ
ncbi:hypothetical protein F5X98DRAFT_331208 [Xylaria grammica]|nr:hypothetical protein F5X98DRAFT_331208 [Xylaria grammica]